MIVIPAREAFPEWRWVGPERVAYVRRAAVVVALVAGVVGVVGVVAVVLARDGLVGAGGPGAGVLGGFFQLGLAPGVVLLIDALVLPLARRLAHGEYVERRGGREGAIALGALAGVGWVAGVPVPVLLGVASGSLLGLVTVPVALGATVVPVVTARWFRLPPDDDE